LKTVFGTISGHVMADPNQLHQVLMNLAVNARDAMPDGGRLVIATSELEVNYEYVARHAEARAGRFVSISVSDTGIGMDEATMQRAFDPFFTTKPQGAGTGLGLSTVYGIVKQSGGWISTYSEVSKGTTFNIYLPKTDEKRLEESKRRPSSLRGTETVLVVEDQEAVRRLTAEMLRVYGYEVLEAANGHEAVRVSEDFARPIHAMISDVIMPGMAGPELASHLKATRPEMRVLFVSGYTAEMIDRKGVLNSDVAFLSKPFTSESLAEKLRERLDGLGEARGS
jgi:two-component system, cell cycle sensor histidine kinase and response regulator CckA